MFLVSKKNMATQLAKLHLNKPQNFWNNLLWTAERCLVTMHSAIFGENQTQHINTNTLYQQSPRQRWCQGARARQDTCAYAISLFITVLIYTTTNENKTETQLDN